MTIAINQDKDIRIYFYLRDEQPHKFLSIYCNNEEKRAKIAREIDNLRRKLQNTNLIIDDTIYEEENFDGFTPMEELNKYRKINMYT